MKLKRVGNKLCRGATTLQTVECSCGGGGPTNEGPIDGVVPGTRAQNCCNGVFGWSPVPPDGNPSIRINGFASVTSAIEGFTNTILDGGSLSSTQVTRNVPLDRMSWTTSGCSVTLSGDLLYLVADNLTAPLTGTNDRFKLWVSMGATMSVSLNQSAPGLGSVFCNWYVRWEVGPQGLDVPTDPLFGSDLGDVYPTRRMDGDEDGVRFRLPLPLTDPGNTRTTGFRTASVRRSSGVLFGGDVTWQGIRFTNLFSGFVDGTQQVDGAILGWQLEGMQRCSPPPPAPLTAPFDPNDPRVILSPENAFKGGCCGQ